MRLTVADCGGFNIAAVMPENLEDEDEDSEKKKRGQMVTANVCHNKTTRVERASTETNSSSTLLLPPPFACQPIQLRRKNSTQLHKPIKKRGKLVLGLRLLKGLLSCLSLAMFYFKGRLNKLFIIG